MAPRAREQGPFAGPAESLRSALFTSRLYRLFLAREVPDRLLQTLNDPWPGDAEKGRAISEGHWRLANQTLTFDPRLGPPEWYPSDAWSGLASRNCTASHGCAISRKREDTRARSHG